MSVDTFDRLLERIKAAHNAAEYIAHQVAELATENEAIVTAGKALGLTKAAVRGMLPKLGGKADDPPAAEPAAAGEAVERDLGAIHAPESQPGLEGLPAAPMRETAGDDDKLDAIPAAQDRRPGRQKAGAAE